MEAAEGTSRSISYGSRVFETVLSTIRCCLLENRFDETICEFLISNVEIFKKQDLKLCPAVESTLSEIVIRCARECLEPISETSNGIHISPMLDTISILLSVLNSDLVVSTIGNSFSESISALDIALERKSEALTKLLRLVDVFLMCLAEHQIYDFFESIPADERKTFEKSISQLLLCTESEFRTYSLAVIRNYCRLTRSAVSISELWKNITRKLLADESHTETCLAVLTHLSCSKMEQKEKFIVDNSAEIWIVLKKCIQSDAIVRKRALSVLKYLLFSCNFQSEHHAWWETYFVIVDSLDEKQSHLVLPVVRLMRTLQNSEVEVDDFWLLNLVEQAAFHDSRTVRMEAFLNLFELKVHHFQEDHLRLLLKTMRACNDSLLFRKILQTKNLDAFKDRLLKWANNLRSSTPSGSDFTKLLFDDIMNQKWSPVPLYYILEILSQYPESCTDFPLDPKVKTFLANVTNSHNIIIRSAVQILFLRILLRNAHTNFHMVIQLFDLIDSCNEKECLQRGTRMWSEICALIRSRVDSISSAETWLGCEFSRKVLLSERSSASTLSSLARNIVLLHDALGLLDRIGQTREDLVKMSTSFRKARSNAYTDTVVQDNYLKLLVSLLKYGITTNIVNRSDCVEITAYVFERIEKNSYNFALVDFYVVCLKEMSSSDSFVVDPNLGALVNDWLPKISRNLSSYSCSMLMEWICDISSRGMFAEKWKKVISFTVRNFVNAKKEESFILNCPKDQICGSVSVAISNYVNTFWRLFSVCIDGMHEHLHDYIRPGVIFGLVFEGFQLARNENLGSIFRTLKHICESNAMLSHEESMIRMMDESWKKLEEIKATPYYQDAVHYWITAFVQLPVLRFKAAYHKTIECYVNEFLQKCVENGEQAFKNVITILKQFSEIENVLLVFPPLTRILVNTFCATHICRKDQRIEYETMDRIRLLHKEYLPPEALEANFIYASEEVRLRALNLVLRAIEQPDVCVEMIETLTLTSDGCRKRYFGDSSFHRTKHKQLQLLLVLECALNRRSDRSSINVMNCYKKIYNFTVRSLLGEPHQPSIRYMLEWLLTRVVIHRLSEFEDQFWLSFSEASEERIGSICSFIMVAFHLANALRIEKFVDMAVRSTLPWSMAQHFNARLYAQSVLSKLINLDEKVKQKYQILECSLVSCLKRGNAVKNSVKLREDFYFSRFHPEEHFTFQTILWELPRLSNISRDEWIQIDLYSQFLTQECGIRLYEDESNSLSTFECSSWVAKASTTTNESESKIAAEVCETQRKFIPRFENVMTIEEGIQSRKRCELIVVASLIDRMPNLGGLTRTCEIFAVSAMILDSIDVVRNKEFTSLSITAEKHLPLIEVKRYDLFNYLKCMKAKQFCIIGIEQATSSRSLDNFAFPSKSIIVLGNEKEGISADLMPVLDVCIEIPQAGVIRSLNVHVSASLIIWEYAKQHIFTS